MTAAILAAFTIAAHAQSAAAVLCDRVAAFPGDPDKPADTKGVASIAPSDIDTAIKVALSSMLGFGARRR